MGLLTDAMSGLGSALLPVAAALLFEELTFGGLVRLLIAPWPEVGKHRMRRELSAGVRKERAQARVTTSTYEDPLWGGGGK